MRTLFLVLALAACGDSHLAPDAAVDPDVANPPDAASPTVSLAAPLSPSNSRVYFQNADSTLVMSATLDPDGNASAVMAAGGFVTLVEPDGQDFAVTTWAGVKPGDQLVFDRVPRVFVSTSITIPVDVGHDVTHYIVYSTCGGYAMGAQPPSDTTVAVMLRFASCPSVDLMVMGVDANEHAKVSFYVPDQLLTPNGSLDLSSKTYSPTVPRTYTVTNNPNPTLEIHVAHDYWTAKRVMSGQPGLFSITGNPATGSQDLPALPAGGFDSVEFKQNLPHAQLKLIDWGGTGADFAFDWTSSVLPQLQTSPQYDFASHTVTWTTVPGGATPDFGGAMLGVRRGGVRWTWENFGPSTDSATFPILPTDLADLNVVASDMMSIEYIDLLKTPGGWDAARPIIELGPPRATTPVGQTLVSSYYGPRQN